MFIAIFLLSAVQAPPDTVALSLPQALARARDASPALAAARAEARAADARALGATRAFLPTLRLEAQGLRTSDPVAVFGLKLRQETFAGTDLALDALNRPDPYGGFAATATAELPLLAPEGLFGYAAARRAAAARNAGAERAGGATVFQVTRAYWDARLAAHRADALDTALAAARGHAAQAAALAEQGMVTGLDVRRARIAAAGLEVRRMAALAEAEIARAQLAALLGLGDVALVLTDSLEPPAAAPTPAAAAAPRSDLEALRLGAEAAALAHRSAVAAQLPQIAAFGTLARHGRATPWGAGSGDWTVGIGVRWTLFPALGGVGAIREAAAERDAAAARLEEATRQAGVERLAAERRLDAATRGLTIAGRADAEARTALEQARLRYRTGSAPISELLDVQAEATRTALDLLAARRDVLVARAALAFAYGAHDR